jgi:hypothetical protein
VGLDLSLEPKVKLRGSHPPKTRSLIPPRQHRQSSAKEKANGSPNFIGTAGRIAFFHQAGAFTFEVFHNLDGDSLRIQRVRRRPFSIGALVRFRPLPFDSHQIFKCLHLLIQGVNLLGVQFSDGAKMLKLGKGFLYLRLLILLDKAV